MAGTISSQGKQFLIEGSGVPSLMALKPILHQAQQILKYDGLVLEGWGQVLERKVAVWYNG